MGKIKSKQIKKIGNFFLQEGAQFNEDFEKNKKITEGIMPSKKLRNQLIGFLCKKTKRANSIKQK